jgi:two-component system, sensor histidine kinase LadS
MAWHRVVLLSAALLLCGVWPVPNAVASGPVGAGDTTYTLGAREMSIFRDPTRSLAIETVASEAFAKKFEPAVRGLNLGYSDDAIWVRVVLQRDANAFSDWLIRYNTSYVDDFRFFVPMSTGFREMQAGDNFAYATRDFPHRTPVFEISLKSGVPNVFYIRMQSDSTLTGSLLLYTRNAFFQAIQRENLLIGGLLAMALVTTLVNFNSFFWSRKRQFLGFSALGVLLITGSMAQLGLWSQMIFQETPWIGDAMVPWTVGVFVFSVILVLRGPLAIQSQYPRINRLLKAIAVIALVAPLTRYVGLYAELGGPIIMSALFIGVSIIAVIAFRNFRSGMEGAGYFFAGFLIFSTSYFVAPLIALGVIAPIPFYEYVWIAGTAGFLFLAYQGAISEIRSAVIDRRRSEARAENALQLASQEQLLRKEQTLFFSGVAHDLRTPLAAISMGLTNLAREIGPGNTQGRDRIERLRTTSKHMADMIERHLQLQRLTHADFQLRRTDANPVELCLSALALIEDAWPMRLFKNRFDEALPAAVQIDGELIQVALVNLLSNAAKYSPNSDPIEIAVQHEPGLVVFAVTDFGGGVSADHAENLFEIYWREARNVQGPQMGKEGFGIGLATVRRIAELHGGRISYQRVVRDGRDATVFRLVIPAS